MWSASASESSGVTGPTSRRMRPRLSRSLVRAVGSSASCTPSVSPSRQTDANGLRTSRRRLLGAPDAAACAARESGGDDRCHRVGARALHRASRGRMAVARARRGSGRPARRRRAPPAWRRRARAARHRPDPRRLRARPRGVRRARAARRAAPQRPRGTARGARQAPDRARVRAGRDPPSGDAAPDRPARAAGAGAAARAEAALRQLGPRRAALPDACRARRRGGHASRPAVVRAPPEFSRRRSCRT